MFGAWAFYRGVGGGTEQSKHYALLQCSKIKKFYYLTSVPHTTSWSGAQEGGSDIETCYLRTKKAFGCPHTDNPHTDSIQGKVWATSNIINKQRTTNGNQTAQKYSLGSRMK